MIRLSRNYLNKSTVLITADHGHDEVIKGIRANDVQELLRVLSVPPYGDARAIYLKLNAENSISDIATLLEQHNIRGNLIRREDAINMGLFGEVNRDIIDRVGDIIFIPSSGSSFIYLYKPDNEEILSFRGQHGGLSERELYVPLIQV